LLARESVKGPATSIKESRSLRSSARVCTGVHRGFSNFGERPPSCLRAGRSPIARPAQTFSGDSQTVTFCMAPSVITPTPFVGNSCVLGRWRKLNLKPVARRIAHLVRMAILAAIWDAQAVDIEAILRLPVSPSPLA